jgi:hypothetical protein
MIKFMQEAGIGLGTISWVLYLLVQYIAVFTGNMDNPIFQTIGGYTFAIAVGVTFFYSLPSSLM